MSPRPETWVLCDGATDPDAPADAIALTLGDASDGMTLDIDGIDAALGGQLSERFKDLVRIATFVLGADGATSRGRVQDEDDSRWRRRFRMVVPVDDPAFWTDSGAGARIQDTLSFLSQDTFRFTWRKRAPATAQQLHFTGSAGETSIPWNDIDHVSLFSGGLDSFVGAADMLLNDKRRVILVSQRPSTKVLNYQRRLVRDLAELAAERGLAAPRHVVVDVIKHMDGLRTEHTQRTRSFLYAAIAGATANLIGLDEIRMYENGIVAINLPVSESVIGARGTRTAHPRVLLGFQKILSLVAGRPMTVSNPYALLTRAEVIEKLSKTPAMSLAKHTISCAHVHKMSTMHPHCGTCSQCIDRRFAFLASGLDEHDPIEGYEHSVETDPWTEESSRALVLSWVSRAHDYASTSTADAFMDSFGNASRVVPPLMEMLRIDADAANSAVFHLHKRHAEVVDRALSRMQRSAAALAGDAAADTLPALVLRRQVEDSGQVVAPRVDADIKNEMRRTGGQWSVVFRNGHPFSLADDRGARTLSRLLGEPDRVFFACDLLALDAGREPNKRPTLGARERDMLRHQVASLEQDRRRAQEFCDDAAAVLCQQEIDALGAILTRATGPSRKSTIEEQCLIAELTKVQAKVCKLNRQMGAYLDKHLRIGGVCWHRHAGMHWDIVDVAVPDEAHQWVSASSLVDKDDELLRDLKRVARFCQVHGVATRPGRTKGGREHHRRREVHKPSFEEAVRRQREAIDHMDTFADRALTERLRRAGDLTRPNAVE